MVECSQRQRAGRVPVADLQAERRCEVQRLDIAALVSTAADGEKCTWARVRRLSR
jgi:hypothetical protein